MTSLSVVYVYSVDVGSRTVSSLEFYMIMIGFNICFIDAMLLYFDTVGMRKLIASIWLVRDGK